MTSHDAMTARRASFSELDLKPGFKVYDIAMLTIGQFADAVGVGAKTLRFYDRMGLLPPATRTPAGYRLYDDRAAQRLHFIRQAKTLGIALADIMRILAIRDEGAAPYTHVVGLVRRNLATVESQIAQLEELRGDLRTLLRQLTRRIPRGAHAAAECPCFDIITTFGNGKGGEKHVRRD